MSDRMNWRTLLAVASCLVILIAVNLMIAGKERHLADGTVVYLKLAPIDPRSLMQGDYMALNYEVVQDIRGDLPGDPATGEGHAVVRLDGRGVGTFVRLDDGTALAPNEVAMRYRVRGGAVRFATNAFFFQEGTGPLYERAAYGQFRVASNGELLLTALHDDELRPLGATLLQ